MAEGKIDQVLEEIRGINGDVHSLKQGQQKNHDLIQKNGVRLEEIGSDVKAVAEGHSVIRREMQEMKTELKADIKEGNDRLEFVAKELGGKIDKVDEKLDEHLRVPHGV